jgi:hypothetical protein
MASKVFLGPVLKNRMSTQLIRIGLWRFELGLPRPGSSFAPSHEIIETSSAEWAAPASVIGRFQGKLPS